MADALDLQAVEEDQQTEEGIYKVYKRRWLVLFTIFSMLMIYGLHKSILPIADILKEHMDMIQTDYELMTQISMYMVLITVLPLSRLIDHFGLRRSLYFACSMIICANGLKALCCSDEDYIYLGVRRNRFYILCLSEVFVGVVFSISICVPAKVASAWFSQKESTIAIILATCGINVGISSGNFCTPLFVRKTQDMYKLSYMYLISGCIVTFITLTCVTRSSPKIPPSADAIVSDASAVPLLSGLKVMLSNPNYILLLITFNLSSTSLLAEQLDLEDMLNLEQYTNTFCGNLIASSYFFGAFFMLLGARWVDKSSDYVQVSRVTGFLFAMTFLAYNISLNFRHIENIIVVTNLLASLGSSLVYPALLQVSLRSAATILPEATVSAIVAIFQQAIAAILVSLMSQLRKLSPSVDGKPNRTGYQAPLLIYGCVIMIVNVLYVALFKMPDREKLQRQLRCQLSRSIDQESLVVSE